MALTFGASNGVTTKNTDGTDLELGSGSVEVTDAGVIAYTVNAESLAASAPERALSIRFITLYKPVQNYSPRH